MSAGTKTKEFLGNVNKALEYGIKETGKMGADLIQSGVKGVIKGVGNTADVLGDVGTFVTDVTGITENAGDKEGWIDRGNKGMKEKLNKVDIVDSKLDGSAVGEAVKGVAEFGGEMVAPLGVLGKLGILKKGGKFFKSVKGQLTEIPGDKITAIVKYTQKGPAQKVLDFIRMNPKKSVLAGGIGGLGLLSYLVGGEEAKVEQPTEEPKTVEPLTGEAPVNSGAANKQGEETLVKTKEELNQTAGAIKAALDAKEITKDEARELLTTIKERASDNFETSISDNLGMKGIDGSFDSRQKIAEAIGIKGYQGTYDQNIQMLDKLKYMDAKEINSLLGNK